MTCTDSPIAIWVGIDVNNTFACVKIDSAMGAFHPQHRALKTVALQNQDRYMSYKIPSLVWYRRSARRANHCPLRRSVDIDCQGQDCAGTVQTRFATGSSVVKSKPFYRVSRD